MEDGLYSVVAAADSPKGLQANAQQRVLVHDQRYVKPEDRDAPTWVLLPTSPAVELNLAEAPTATDDALLLSFTPEAARELRDFTARSVDKGVAVVIGGEIVTLHTIRTAIDGGKLQVSC